MAVAVKAIVDRNAALEATAAPWQSIWSDIRTYILPRSEDVDSPNVTGGQRRRTVYDGTGEYAASLLASAIMGLTFNAAGSSFALIVPDRRRMESRAVREWLEDSTDRMHWLMRSEGFGFEGETHSFLQEDVGFCWGLTSLIDRPGGLPLYRAETVGECRIDEDAEGRVDTVYRRAGMTARQIVQKFPATAPETIRRDADRGIGIRREVLHAVEPDPEGRRLPFQSAYVFENTTLLAEAGFFELPYQPSRYAKRPREIYGRGPGTMAISDVKMVNEVERVGLRAWRKNIDPPLAAHDDGISTPKIKSGDGAVTPMRFFPNGALPVQPLITGGNPRLGEEKAEITRQKIRQVFLVDLLTVMTANKQTATQVLALEAEVARILAPTTGRFRAEWKRAFLERLFRVMRRGGWFGPEPDELGDAPVDVDYRGQAARTEKLGAAEAVSQYTDWLRGQAELLGPGVYAESLRRDEANRVMAEALGVPESVIPSPEEAAAIRERAQQAQQAQAAVDTAIQAAGPAAKLIDATTQEPANAA